MSTQYLVFALLVSCAMVACGSDSGASADATTSTSDATSMADAGPQADANTMITCSCDTSDACDGWCYCDTDCPNPCACDVTSWCDSGCACDTACNDPIADVYPYNLCHNNSDCNDGGFCDKGTCINFCGPVSGTNPRCGFGFDCNDEVCLYSCNGPEDCFGAGDCCENNSCLPAALCAEGTGPAGWTCAAEYYATGDGCDCECGDAVDPDCGVGGSCTWCHENDPVTFLCPAP